MGVVKRIYRFIIIVTGASRVSSYCPKLWHLSVHVFYDFTCASHMFLAHYKALLNIDMFKVNISAVHCKLSSRCTSVIGGAL